jgi:hypothetical protein
MASDQLLGAYPLLVIIDEIQYVPSLLRCLAIFSVD